MLEPAVHGVVVEEIREAVRRDEVVDPDEFESTAADARAIDETTDATETVDTDSNGH
jgi:hypothetical protein